MLRAQSLVWLSPLLLILSAAGCGNTDRHCDFTDRTTGKVKHCQERLGSLASSAFEATAQAAGGTCSSGPCVQAGASGGCALGTQGDGSKVNDWYYAPFKSVADVMKQCMDDGATFLPAGAAGSGADMSVADLVAGGGGGG